MSQDIVQYRLLADFVRLYYNQRAWNVLRITCKAILYALEEDNSNGKAKI